MEPILESLIGLTLDAARAKCKENNFNDRVVCEDGVHYIVTCDFRTDRVNLTLENNLVIKCDIG